MDCSRVLSWVQASKLTGALNEEQLFASIALFVRRLVFTSSWPPTFLHHLGHPSWRTTTPLATTGSNTLEYDYRLLDAFTFGAKFGQHFVDFHLLKV